jgi:uncharacterized protein (TIGR02588 family)
VTVREHKPRREQRTTRAEALIALVSAGVLVLLVVYLVRDGLIHPGRPPELIVSRGDVVAMGDGHVVRFTVENRGDIAATSIDVEGELTLPGREPESATASLDFVAPGSKRGGALRFQADPGTPGAELEIHVEGWQDP